MKLHVGTSGYSYKEWKGTFYPEKIDTADMLRFYATHFGTVEINNTFYRMPNQKTLAQWSEQVPDSFVFVIKASRKITHLKRLLGTDSELSYLLGTVGTLGSRLGPILFQLPPNMKKDIDRLVSFLRLLPGPCQPALEFRHESWFDDDVYEAAAAHNACLVWSDAMDRADGRYAATANFGYLRLRREAYADEDLQSWCDKIAEQLWDAAFVFLKHEEEATGPQLASRFSELWQGRGN
jgi:uncharacterized protein YecE (DUF72 family)